MNLLKLFNKFIEEHGSSTIQSKHLAFLKEQISVFQNEQQKLESENRELRIQLENLKPPETPQNKCPYCLNHTGRLIRATPHKSSLLRQMGVKVGNYKCTNKDCEKSYEKQIEA